MRSSTLRQGAAAALAVAALTVLTAPPLLSQANATPTDPTANPADAAGTTRDAHEGIATQKSETVHVNADAQGTVRDVSVSVKLDNGKSYETLADTSRLADVKDADGDAPASQNGEVLVWDAQGSNVNYTGTSTEQPPVDVKVTYLLDGEEISPDELAGKTGAVTLRFDFTNHTDATFVGTAGSRTASVPFVAMTGLIMPDDVFSNIEVDNGKVISEGGRTIVVGYALPGMAESLGIADSDVGGLELPSSFTVTADAQDFALDGTLTYLTGDLLADANTDNLGLGNLSSGLSQLQTSLNQLIDGSDALTSGLDQLPSGSAAASAGAEELATSARALPAATSSLAGGSQQLADGAATAAQAGSSLADALDRLSATAATLDADSQSALAAAGELETAAAQADDSAGALADDSAALAEGVSQAQGALNDGADALTAQEQSVREDLADLTAKRDAAAPEAQPAYDEAIAALEDTLQALSTAQQKLTDAGDGLDDAAAQSHDVAQDAAALAALTSDLSDRAADLTGTRDAGLTNIAGQTALLSQALAQTSEQSQEGLATGLAGLADGADQLAAGAGQIDAASQALSGGLDQLSTGSAQVASANSAAADGSAQLSAGLQAWRDQGFQKLVDAMDGDLGGLADGVEAMTQASRSYTSFSGITEGTKGSVWIVYQTDAIGSTARN